MLEKMMNGWSLAPRVLLHNPEKVELAGKYEDIIIRI